jgi:hypothetical protein
MTLYILEPAAAGAPFKNGIAEQPNQTIPGLHRTSPIHAIPQSIWIPCHRQNWTCTPVLVAFLATQPWTKT